VKVERFVAVHDCGRPINPLALTSQINGGIIQGGSYALYENRILDRNTGLMVNPNLEEYKITGSRETPHIDVLLIEEYLGASSTDAAGIGEPSTIPAAACVANAIYNAIGVRVRDLPITPAKVLAALAEHPLVRERAPFLAEAVGHAATPQIRNMATLGGNLLQRPRCWYFRSDDFPCRRKGGDICFAQEGENQYHALFANSQCAIVHPSATASPLIALGASIKVQSPKGERTIPLEKFFVLPNQDIHKENTLASDEMITQVIIPAPPAGTKMAYVRQTAKDSFDWPLADVSVVLEMDGTTCKSASIVLGAAAPAPWRSKEAERAITGKTVDAKTAGAAAIAAMKSARP
jgi:xanthine dehydrogenase YagS FAD-binding subunit